MTLDQAEAEVTVAETSAIADADRQRLCHAAYGEACRYGADGWDAAGVGLWNDRARAERIGRRWRKLAESLS